MDSESQRPQEQEDVTSRLNAAIEALNRAEKASSVIPVKTVFGSAIALLRMIRDSTANELDYVELGLSCAGVCRALDRGTNGVTPAELSKSVYDTINQLTLTVADIERKLVKWGKRSPVSRRFHAKSDKETIATWRLDLDKILQVFNELVINTDVTDSAIRHDVVDTHTIVSGTRNDAVSACTIVSNGHRNTAPKSPGDMRGQDGMTHASAPGESLPPPQAGTRGTVSDIRYDVGKAHSVISEVHRDLANTHAIVSDIHRNMLRGRDGAGDQNGPPQTSIPGESPPHPPRVFFGRDDLIEKIIGFADSLTPIALIGAGGIGKTSIALTVLHDDRIKQRFGDNRRFVRCDQFPASHPHFLHRLSEIIGADVESPESLNALHPFLSSKEMMIVLDNAESILDPQGTDSQEIYATAEELSRFSNICVCITSRISTIPPDCEIIDVPTLSMEAARDTFYRIYRQDDRSDSVDNVLERLDFHPLSITLLATVAQHNRWDTNRLVMEWEQQRTSVLHTRQNKSLAAAIELSLASPLFQELGPDARALLGVVAFFPQGVNEKNLDWLLPTISNGTAVLDGFCILSLTYRSSGFVTMLAPLRDYLSPKDPKASSLLSLTKEGYFTRMSVALNPEEPNFGEAQWIISEDVNVEHLLDVFTTIDPDSDRVWDACADFMTHLSWHKRRLTILKPKIEGLPDDRRFKPDCLFGLSRLFKSVGNSAESRRVLTHALQIWREQGNDYCVAQTLVDLSDANRLMGHYKEGIQLAKEALEILGRLGNTMEQAQCLNRLAFLLFEDAQPDAAQEAASRAIDLLPERNQQSQVCQSYCILGHVHQSKGERRKAIHYYEIALGIASSFNWHGQIFQIHYSLAALFVHEDRFDDARTHMEQAKSNPVNNAYELGHVMELYALSWYRQHRLEEAKSEASCAVDAYEKLGLAMEMDRCKKLLRWIEEEMNNPVALYFEGIGWHRSAYLFRRILFLRCLLRRSVFKSGLGSLSLDVYLVACVSLLVPFIFPSQYSPSRLTALLYLCVVLYFVLPRR